MESKIFFSVIVTAYNCENYILETLSSVANQTFTDYEVIVIDDKSHDSTHKLVFEFVSGKTNWTLYSNDINKGVVYSRNKAISLTNGQYVAILDGDDVWEKEKLSKQYEVLKDGEIGLCYTSYSFIDEKSKPIKFVYHTKETASYKSLLKENYIGCSTVVIRADIAKTTKMNKNVSHEDYYYWLTLLKNDVKARGIVEPLVRYRIHSESRSYNKVKSARDRYVIYSKFEKLSLIKSLWNFFLYACRSLLKYLKIGISSERK